MESELVVGFEPSRKRGLVAKPSSFEMDLRVRRVEREMAAVDTDCPLQTHTDQHHVRLTTISKNSLSGQSGAVSGTLE